eukprot:TRINITY_DN20651_c0_g1_i1.p1 TRINITY_DN20651_c0_g1~~TRINITY_DN20651_c0_g1_i1.p1  ORF type:complete len:462 (-),score=98.26 TRINITY_DN20651_c0_g1_i1:13-1341(-)
MGQRFFTGARPSEEALAQLASLSLEVPESYWGPARSSRFRWAVNVRGWLPFVYSCSCGDEEFDIALSCLPPSEQEAVESFKRMSDRKRALLGRLMVRRACAQVLGVSEFDNIEICRTRGGKPFLRQPQPPNMPNFNFSISHDGHWVVLASDPLFLVGVDVSAPQEARGDAVSDDWLQDLELVLTENEKDIIQRGASVQERYAIFQRIWSAKESFSKAVGTGLDFGFERLEVTLIGGLPKAGQSIMSAITNGLLSLPALVTGMTSDSGSRSSDSGLESKRSKTDGNSEARTVQPQADQSTGEGQAERRPKTNSSQQSFSAEISIDSFAGSSWKIVQQELSGTHWVSVALGPVEEAVDADGVFSATFCLSEVGGPGDLLEAKKMPRKPGSGSNDDGAYSQTSANFIDVDRALGRDDEGGFQVLSIRDLLPEKARQEFDALRPAY